MLYSFGDFELDTQRYELRRAGIRQPLEPQGFNVLRYLLDHPDRVVTKEELLENLWPNQAVSESTLTQRLMAVRRALGESGRTPRYVRTVHRRGYRFIAAVEVRAGTPPLAQSPLPAAPVPPPVAPAPPPSVPPGFIGREAELRTLRARFAQALQGRRQCVLLSGEAGIGKTTLVDAFLSQIQAEVAVWVGRGQCVEHYGAGEAYLPLLEILGRLGRGPGGVHLSAALRQQAPSWLLHLPALVSAAEYSALQQQAGSFTRERMLRELAEVVEGVTATQPLLIVLEDLHWGDISTIDWLIYVAQRRDPAPLFILGTYRPSDALVRNHPVHTAVQELQRQGHALVLTMPYWSMDDVTTYLTQRFGPDAVTREGVDLLHHHSHGNPFFLVTMVDTLEPQHLLLGGQWDTDAVSLPIPDSVRRLIEAQLERLSSEEQTVLETASVAGESFATATVAAGLAQTVDEVESRCAALARKGQFVRALGVETWPDATVATRYGFVHTLYQEVLYERLAVGRRLRLHQHIGLHKEGAYGARAADIAAELAMHFVRAQDTPRAIQYLRQVAETAASRHAHHEVIAALSRALALLRALPGTAALRRQELDILLALGPALMANKGQAAPEVEQTYVRARALCVESGATSQLFPILGSLCQFYISHGALQTARELGEQLDYLAQREPELTHRLEAHVVLGRTLFNLGEYAAAYAHLDQGLRYIDPATQRQQVRHHSVAPGVQCLALTSDVLWCQGYPSQAVQRMQEALALAQELEHPYSLARVHYWAAFLHHRCRNVPAVQAHAEAFLSLVMTQDAPFVTGYGTYWQGWALMMQGQETAGLALLHEGITNVLATGQAGSRSYFLVLRAEVMHHLGQVEEGLRLLEEAMAVFAASGWGDMLSEAHRLRGELLLRRGGDGNPPAPSIAAQAEACFQQALALAQHQQAKSWELRAAISLARLWQQQGRRDDARALLAPVYGWFTEGFAMADHQQAHALLVALESAATDGPF